LIASASSEEEEQARRDGFYQPFDEASKDLAEAKKKTGASAPVFGTAMRA
jgi:predicted N-formylglutamate amidohydrolase